MLITQTSQQNSSFFGFDFLALGNYTQKDVETILRLPKSVWIGCFFTGFRAPTEQIRLLFSKGFRNFRVHLVWDDKHKVNETRMKSALQTFDTLRPIFEKSNTIVSLHCEPNFDPHKAYSKYLNRLQGFRILKRSEEVHHEFRSSKIFSHDGEGIEDQNATKNLRYLRQTTEIFFFWHNAFNYFTRDITIRPYDRIQSVWDDYFRAWVVALGRLIAQNPTKEKMLNAFQTNADASKHFRFIPVVWDGQKWMSKVNNQFFRLRNFNAQKINNVTIFPVLPV